MKTLCLFGLLVLPSSASWNSPPPSRVQAKAEGAAADSKVVEAQLPTYPLKVCPVSGESLGSMGEPVNYVHAGRLVRFCCKNCINSFTKAPEAAFKQIDDAVVADQGKRYPLKVCPVSGKPIDPASAINYVHQTRLVRLCSEGCKQEVDKRGDAIMTKVDASWVAAQLPTYPLEFCVISGKKLEGVEKPDNYLYGTRLVRLCCSDCRAEFQKNPDALLAKIHAARQKDKEQKPEGAEGKKPPSKN